MRDGLLQTIPLPESNGPDEVRPPTLGAWQPIPATFRPDEPHPEPMPFANRAKRRRNQRSESREHTPST